MGAGAEAALTVLLRLRNEMGKELGGVRSQLDGIARATAGVGLGMTAGISAPLIAIGKQALDTAMDYEGAMNLFQATTSATGDQMKTVGELAIALGADMTLPATSAADAGTAMLELAKAGLSVEQSMAAAKGTLQLAAAGQLSEAQAAEIAANALNMFKLSGDQATTVADLLAAAANASSGSVYDMADSLKMVGTVAGSAGMPIQDVVAAISEMANQGMKGSDAGTSLKQMLLALQAPTKKTRGLMADLGISVYDAHGAMLPMRGIIEQFRGKLAGLSQEQRNAALATIFGSDAVRAANVVLMSGADAFDKMRAAVTKQGAAQELAGAQMKGLKGALAGLGRQFETLLLTAAIPFMRTLEGLARGAADFIGRLQETNPEILQAAVVFGAVLAAAGPLMLAIGGLATLFGFLLSPIGLVVLAVAGLAAAFAGNFGGIRTTVETWWGATKPKLEEAWSTLTGKVGQAAKDVATWWETNFPRARTAVETWWGATKPKLEEAWSTLTGKVGQAASDVATWWETNFPRAKTAVETWWANIQQPLKDAASWVGEKVGGAVKDVATWSEENWPKAQTAVTTWWDGVKEPLKEAAAAIGEKIGGAVKDVATWFEENWPKAQTAVTTWWDGIKEPLKEAVKWIRDETGQAVKDLAQWFQENWPKMKVEVQNWWTETKRNLEEAKSFFGEKLPKALEDYKKQMGPLTDVLKSYNEMQKKVNELLKAYKEVTEAAHAKTLEWKIFLIGVFLGALQQVGGYIERTFGPAFKTIKETFEKIAEVVSGALQEAFGGLDRKMTDVKPTADIFSTALNGIKNAIDGISTAIGSAIKWLNDLADKIRNLPSPAAIYTPGSPTPFETGLVGIAKAATAAADALPSFGKAVESLGDSSSNAGQNIPAGIAAGIDQFAPLSLGALGAHVKAIVDELARLANSVIEPAAIQSAKAVTDPLATILENVGKMVDGLEKLAGLKTPVTITAQLEAVSDAVKAVVDHYAWMANHVVAGAAVMSAKAFSDPVAVIFDNLSKIVEGTQKLSELVTAGVDAATISGQMTALGSVVESLVKALSEVAGRIPDLGAAASVLAQNAGPALEIVGPALAAFHALVTDGFTMLRADGPFGVLDSYTPIVTRIQGLSNFLRELIAELGPWAASLADLLPPVKALGEHAAPLLAVVAPTLDAFHALVTKGFAMLRDDGPFGVLDSYTPMLTRIQGLSAFLRELAAEIAPWATELEDLLPGMKTLGESVGPLLAVVAPTLEAFYALLDKGFAMLRDDGPFGVLDSYTPMLTRIQGLSNFLRELAAEIAPWADSLKGLLPSLKTLADNVGPVLALIGPTLEAFKTLSAPLPAAPDSSAFSSLGGFIEALARALGTAAGNLGGLDAAAKKLAENAGPVVGVVRETVEAMTALQGIAKVNLAGAYGENGWIAQAAGFLGALVSGLAAKASDVSAADMTAAKGFATDAAGVVGSVEGSMKVIQTLAASKKIPAAASKRIVEDLSIFLGAVKKAAGDLGADGVAAALGFADAAETVGAALVAGLLALKGNQAGDTARSLAGALGGLVAAAKGAVLALRDEFAGLKASGYDAGYGWAEQLAQGISAGLPLVTAAVQAVANLFPHSPAKAGPLREEPNWNRFLLGGLLPTVGQVGDVLSGAMSAPGSVGWSGGGAPLAPAPVGASGPVIIQFTYAPTVSLADEREAEERIAPMLQRVIEREKRRR